ncbi:SDR family oxidoreductase [Patescibacteria group bacterium]|nr:SDR family oxidoreductase [Patescibacteria group bacterium]
MKLENKTALITGGSQGIGKAIAGRFIREGAKAIVFDVKKPDYEAEFYQVDIREEEQIKAAFEQIKSLDILVNNAGVYFEEAVESTTKKQLDDIVDTNIKGTYLMCTYGIPLIKNSKGTIINISSGLGLVPDPAAPAYCATKAAITMLTKCMAQEYAAEGVRINAILPGPIDTPMLRSVFASEKEFDDYAKSNPLGKIGKVEDVANVAAFLASDEASYVTGSLYTVDGGESSSSLHSK